MGIIDTGIWPEHPSFSDRQDLSSGSGSSSPFAYTVLGKQQFRGQCVAGERFTPSQCTRKLVGCQHFSKSFGPSGGVKALYPEEVESCRDIASHGTHTASTAGGNYGVPFRGGIISGMAPRARIAAYKVCWGLEGGSCPQADIIAALDKAVADGVDVVNMSLGSDTYEFPDLLATALLQVARAGVFVAASAGNDGPKEESVQNAAPWITTVAASNHNRAYRATVVLGGGGSATAKTLTLVGSGFYMQGLEASPVILAQQGAKAQANMARAQQCYSGTLDAAKVRGKVVACDRGGNARADKAAAVKEAGGIGVLLLNTPSDADWANAQRYAVPTVHLLAALRDQVRSFISAAGSAATAAFLPIVIDLNATAPVVSAFSSRGPEPSTGGAVVKPDLSAPGVDIAAAASPEDKAGIRDAEGNAFALLSGTSMSSPHVAGLAALLRQAHPDWSPMAIKSAMMTTAYRFTRTGNTSQQIGKNPFAFGAGHVNPEKMLNPGLIFDSGFSDWAKFACAAAKPANVDLPASIKEVCNSCAAAAAAAAEGTADPACTSPAELNLPSISLPSIVAGSTKIVTRRVTSVLNTTATFSAVQQPGGASGPLRVDSITPRSFTLAPGASQEIQIAVRIMDAALGGGWVFAAAMLQSDQDTMTRIPIAAKASQFEAPPQVKPSKDSTAFSYQITPGWRGTLDIRNLGLAAPTILRGSMMSSNRDGYPHNITVPAGTSYLRISMFAGDLQPASCCDLDLRLSQGLQIVGSSWTPGAADEQIWVRSPDPGRYTVRVLGGYDKAPRRVSYFVYVWMLSGSSSSSSSSSNVSALDLPSVPEVTVKAHDLKFLKLASTVIRDLLLVHFAPKSSEVLPPGWKKGDTGVPYVKLAMPIGDAAVPTKRKHWTVIRGPHVHKTSREQFARITQTRVITYATNNASELAWFLDSLKLYKFIGVELLVKAAAAAAEMPGRQLADAVAQQLQVSNMVAAADAAAAAAEDGSGDGQQQQQLALAAAIDKAMLQMKLDVLDRHKLFPYLMAFYQPGQQQLPAAEWMHAMLKYGKVRQAEVASSQAAAGLAAYQQLGQANHALLLLLLQQWHAAADAASRRELALPDEQRLQSMVPADSKGSADA
ncbi:hypothetical protein OEZ86_004651 [Tetradesmus obliquus]|nr:hypothetical protein OEZ86_004651 [Tetradesmus obliquus]